VREGLDKGRVDREDGVEEVGEADSVGLRHKAEEAAIGLKAPWATALDQFQPSFVSAIQYLLGDPSGGWTIDERKCVRAVPFCADNGDHGPLKDAPDGRVRLEVLEFHREGRDIRGSNTTGRVTPATPQRERTPSTNGVLRQDGTQGVAPRECKTSTYPLSLSVRLGL
jgi:hypothetical protein